MFTRKIQYGFTLIELLVVISIISLLSSVVLTGLSTARMKARDSKRIQEIVQISRALELYRSNIRDDAYPVFTTDTTYPGYTGQSGSGDLEQAYSIVYPTTNWAQLEYALSPYLQLLPRDPINKDTGNFGAGSLFYWYHRYGIKGYLLCAALEVPKGTNNPLAGTTYSALGITPYMYNGGFCIVSI